jgi:8-oxo-dGTP pyrophosphatase MutT (NUDIX family)
MKFILLHKIANHIIRKYQSLVGISTLGARALILNSENQILLVKHTYQSHWYMPGGGVMKGETVKAAVVRELKEEVGVTVLGEPELFGIYYHTYLGVNDYPVIYIVKKFSLTDCNSAEIEKMGWFAYDNLPAMTSPGTRRRLQEYFTQSQRSETW